MNESRTPRTNEHAEWLRNRAASPYFALARLGLLDSANVIEILESSLTAAQSECQEQSRLLGMGAEREARLLARIAELEAERERLAKDARRYEWLVTTDNNELHRSITHDLYYLIRHKTETDSAIDAAIAQEQPK